MEAHQNAQLPTIRFRKIWDEKFSVKIKSKRTFNIEKEKNWMSLRKKGKFSGRLCWVYSVYLLRNWVFQVLNCNVCYVCAFEKFKERKSQKFCVFLCKLFTFWRVGCLWKDVGRCRVMSSVQEWVKQGVWLGRSLIDNRKRVGIRIEPWGTPLLWREEWPSTTAAIVQSERKLEMNLQTELWKVKELKLYWIYSKEKEKKVNFCNRYKTTNVLS